MMNTRPRSAPQSVPGRLAPVLGAALALVLIAPLSVSPALSQDRSPPPAPSLLTPTADAGAPGGVTLVAPGPAPAAPAWTPPPARLAAATAMPESARDGATDAAPAPHVLTLDNRPVTYDLPLVPVSTGADGYLVEGERGTLEYVLDLAPGTELMDATLTLAFSNSIEVNPDTSQLFVSLNGVELAALPLRAVRKPTVAEIVLPLRLMRGGRNTVRVHVAQQHRVQCTLDSTYELWTRVAAETSHVSATLVAAPLMASLGSFREMMHARIRSHAAVGIIMADTGTPTDDTITWGAHLSQAVALRSPDPVEIEAARLPPVIADAGLDGDFPRRDFASLPYDRMVLVGTAADLRGIVSARIQRAIKGPYLAIALLPDAPEKSVLVVSGRDARDVTIATEVLGRPDSVLPNRAEALVSPPGAPVRPTGASAGTAETARPTLKPELIYTMSDFGLPSHTFDVLRGSRAITFDLPTDFLPVQDSVAQVYVNAAYAPNLGKGSVLKLVLNGKIVGSIPLDVQTGEVIERHRIDIPMDAFASGRNTLAFEADLPLPSDTGCMSVAGTERLTVFGSTSMTLPPHAHLMRLPNLKIFRDAAAPYWPRTASGPEIVLFVPQPSRPALGAAWTLVGQMARVSDSFLPIQGAVAFPRMVGRDMISVGPTSAFDTRSFAGAPFRLADLTSAWQRHPPMPARDAATSEELEATRATNAVLDRIRAMQSGIGPGQTDPAEPSLPPEQAVYTETQDPLDRWHRRIEEAQRDRDQGWFLDPVLGVVDATVFAVGDFFEQTVRAIQPPVVPVRPLYLSEDRTANALLLQYESPQALEKTWTTLIAPSEGTLLSAAHQLVQADTWNALDGQAVALSPEMVKVVLPVPLDPYFVRTSDPSTRELWLLASNAVSQYLLVWVCLVLITIALLGVTTSRLVRRMGRSSATDR